MSSLGYSDFNTGGSSGNVPGSDGYIASKRKNKTVKAFETMTNVQQQQQSQPNGRTNPKLERLRASIAKIHAASSDEDDDNDANDDTTASVLPTYPGSSASDTGLKVSPPIADAGSGNQASTIAPTTNEGRTHQPMFSMSQQFGSKMGSGSEGSGVSGGGGIEQFKMNAPSTYAAQYYKQLAPYNYNKLSNELAGPGSNDEFIEKLNYIIHLLEEQHNERTEHVTEELVLYCFLGVFIIFIVDSFARAGKYTR
jgi:hypothetical protein